MKIGRIGLLTVGVLLASSQAWGQTAGSSGAVDLGEDEGESDFTQKTDSEDELSEPAAEPAPPVEEAIDPDELQILLGARYRFLIVPQFLINAFGVEGGTTVTGHGIGPEIGFSKKNYEFRLSGWYAALPMSDTPFKAPGDGPDAWEMWNSQAGAIFISADILLKKEITKGWDWTVGGSGGIGIVTGTLSRYETYWTNGFSGANPGDPYKDLVKCIGPGEGPVGTANPGCENPGDYSNAAPWPVYPWLSFQTGVRYQPVRNFVARLDLGVGSTGFWLGLGADYGL